MADVEEDQSAAAQEEPPVESVEISAHIATEEEKNVKNPEQQEQEEQQEVVFSSSAPAEAPAEENGEAEPPGEANEPQENATFVQEPSPEDAGNPADDVGEPPDETTTNDKIAEEVPIEQQNELNLTTGNDEQQEEEREEQQQQQTLQEALNEEEEEEGVSMGVGEEQKETPEVQDKEEDGLEAQELLKKEEKEGGLSFSDLEMSDLGFLSQIRAAIEELGGIGDLLEEHEEALKRLRDRRTKLTVLSKRLSALVKSDSSPTSPSHASSPAGAQQPLPLAHAFRRATLLAKDYDDNKRARLALRATTRQTLQKQSLRLHEPPQRTRTPTPPKRVEP